MSEQIPGFEIDRAMEARTRNAEDAWGRLDTAKGSVRPGNQYVLHIGGLGKPSIGWRRGANYLLTIDEHGVPHLGSRLKQPPW